MGFTVQNMARTRGVRGASSACALAAFVYLLTKSLLTAAVNLLMDANTPGASLSSPTGFSVVTVELLQILVGIGSIVVPVGLLLSVTRLRPADMNLARPAPWSPAFSLPVFLGVANAANLFGALVARLTDRQNTVAEIPVGGAELAVCFVALCVVPPVTEELLFRGAMQGLMRPCGSAAAIFAPALLFALLHLDLAQGITAFVCAVFLGWLTERTGSILPGILLHFANNAIAFMTAYLTLYAPENTALAVSLFVLIFFPLCALWMLNQAHRQGLRWSAGMRPGVEALDVFSSPTYLAAVAFLVLLSLMRG